MKTAITLFAILQAIFSRSFGQEMPDHPSPPGTEHPRVEWVAQFPSGKSSQSGESLAGKIGTFLFGKKTEDPFTRPVGLIASDPGNMFILDQENGNIRHVSQNMGEITHLKNKKFNSLPSLVGICEIPGQGVLFSDSYLNKLFIFIPGKKNLEVFNDTLTLFRPTGVACSPVTGEVWVTETAAHRVTVLDRTGRPVRRIGTRGTGPGEFNFPTALWIGGNGTVYVVDAMNFRIQIFSPGGEYLSCFGKQGDASGCFARPRGIATDSRGNIYITDALFNAVQVFDARGTLLHVFGSQGREAGQFWMPSGIFIDPRDYIYIADSYNSRVQVFRLETGAPK